MFYTIDTLQLRADHGGIDPTKFRVEWPFEMPIDARFTAQHNPGIPLGSQGCSRGSLAERFFFLDDR